MNEPEPPERWIVAFTPGPDGPPMAVRMKQVIKYALRVHGLRCELLPDAVQTPAPDPEVEAKKS